jgi:predicted PurR-regulated permease PerM
MPIRRRYDQYFWLAGIALIVAVLLYLLSPILSPFLFSAILAYICDPFVDKLEAHRVPRALGTVIAMVLVIGAIVLLLLIIVPLFYKEAMMLYQRLPALFAQFADKLEPWLQSHFGIQAKLDLEGVKALLGDNLQDAQGVAGKVLASLRIGGLALVGFLVNLLLIPVVFFYLLRDWDLMIARIDDMIPRRWHEQVATLAREVDAVLAEFLRGQLLVIVIMAAYYTIGLWLTGLDFALPVGIITGLLVFVPYVGMLTGLILATLAALLQFSSLSGLVLVWIVFAIGQALEGMVVTPWLVGNRVGLHPVAVIFALLAFGQIFGFFGILLALPASAALLVWLRHIHRGYLRSQVYNG